MNFNSVGKLFGASVGVVDQYSGGYPFVGNALAFTNSAPDHFSGGLGFNGNKVAVAISEVALVTPVYSGGLAFNGTGALYMNLTLPVAAYRGGLPVASNGTVCVSTSA